MIVRAQFAAAKSMAEVVRDLGGIALERIRAVPAPGTATEADLMEPHAKLCELVDGVVVEKAMGDRESLLGHFIGRRIGNHVEAGDLGVVLGEAGHIRVRPDQLRAPDVTYIPWSAFPAGEIPDEAYWSVTPDLIVEVLSPDNTTPEIDRKLREFFAMGCKLAWVIHPPTRTAKIYTSAKRFKLIDAAGTLDGGKVLPGFTLPLADVFAATKPRKKPH